MRKNSGIIRNKSTLLTEAKNKLQRKKHRFQSINKNDESFQTSTPNSTTEQGIMVSSAIMENDEQHCKAAYEKAKEKLAGVMQIQKKMTFQSKARLSSFKQKQNQRYDESISKLASEATNLLLQAEKCLKQMSGIESKNQSDKKLIQNMCQSLALEIRQISRNLRQQQKQYFDTIRAYEKNTKNTAIELSQQQRQMMKGIQEQMVEQTNDMLNNKKVDELVKNINKLSTIYKQLNNLVIEQGSLIDRIDVNIESTLQHTKQAVVHLEAADEHASSTIADKVMKVLVIMILILAIILGLKWMA